MYEIEISEAIDQPRDELLVKWTPLHECLDGPSYPLRGYLPLERILYSSATAACSLRCPDECTRWNSVKGGCSLGEAMGSIHPEPTKVDTATKDLPRASTMGEPFSRKLFRAWNRGGIATLAKH